MVLVCEGFVVQHIITVLLLLHNFAQTGSHNIWQIGADCSSGIFCLRLLKSKPNGENEDACKRQLFPENGCSRFHKNVITHL